jgi:hypothetical protein
MQAAEFLETFKDHVAWRGQSAALRRSAEVLWDEFFRTVLTAAKKAKGENSTFLFPQQAEDLFQSSQLLYGLALETALKAWIIETKPSEIELRVTMDGAGQAVHAELRALGVPAGQGHNLLSLAEVAGLFSTEFESAVKTPFDAAAMRNICRYLSEMVQWRGRYPVPLASFEPIKLDPDVPQLALAHYMRDWLDPVLDVLLRQESAPIDPRKWLAPD